MHFDFLKRLGAGYFGEVWLAKDLGLNAERAVKLIPPNKVPDQNNFFREAQLLKTAEHPNIVKVESTGVLGDGRVFVAMEHLPKGSLEDEAKGGYVHLSRAKRIMIDVLRGLAHAHAKGLIHHDIKPGNILVGNSGEGKLSDFGLAICPKTDGVSVRVQDYNYKLHIAPEVYRQNLYSVQSDIYACGVTLYRLVNGDSYLPVLDPTIIEGAVCSGKFPDRTRYRDFIPRPFRTVISKAMSVDAKDRYSSADEMRHAVERLVVKMNWIEQVYSDRTKWVAGWDARCYEVEKLDVGGGTFDITVRKGRSRDELRRMNALCQERVPAKKAPQVTSRILQDFVLGRIL